MVTSAGVSSATRTYAGCIRNTGIEQRRTV
jgi:hypothetical protein